MRVRPRGGRSWEAVSNSREAPFSGGLVHHPQSCREHSESGGRAVRRDAKPGALAARTLSMRSTRLGETLSPFDTSVMRISTRPNCRERSPARPLASGAGVLGHAFEIQHDAAEDAAGLELFERAVYFGGGARFHRQRL